MWAAEGVRVTWRTVSVGLSGFVDTGFTREDKVCSWITFCWNSGRAYFLVHLVVAGLLQGHNTTTANATSPIHKKQKRSQMTGNDLSTLIDFMHLIEKLFDPRKSWNFLKNKWQLRCDFFCRGAKGTRAALHSFLCAAWCHKNPQNQQITWQDQIKLQLSLLHSI